MELARAVAWLRFSVWVHGVCNQDRSWSNDGWEGDKIPTPGVTTLKLTAHDFRPTPGKPGCQHCAHRRMLVTDVCSMLRGMNKPCIPFCGVQGGLSRVHFSHATMQVELFPQVFWCARCGAISTKQTKLLLAPCRGVVTRWGKYVCNQLGKGYMPKVASAPERVWVGTSRLVRSGFEPTHRGDIDWLPI